MIRRSQAQPPRERAVWTTAHGVARVTLNETLHESHRCPKIQRTASGEHHQRRSS